MITAIFITLFVLALIALSLDIVFLYCRTDESTFWAVSWGIFAIKNGQFTIFGKTLTKKKSGKNSAKKTAKKENKDVDTPDDNEKRKNNDNTTKKKNDGFANFFKSFSQNEETLKKIIRVLWNLLSGLFKDTRLKVKDARLEFGLGDPAATGMLAGVLYAINICEVEPDFMQVRFSATGKFRARLRTAKLFLRLIIFVFSLPIYSLIKIYMKKKRTDKLNASQNGAN
jgi:hypothetical protein